MPFISRNQLTMALCSFLFVLILHPTRAGWEPNGGYSGAYPAGCTKEKAHQQCPPGEHCIYDEEECLAGEKEKCRCMMGCLKNGHYLRMQQWRMIEDGGKAQRCMCVSKNGERSPRCEPFNGEF